MKAEPSCPWQPATLPQAQEALQRQDELLQSVSFVATHLATADPAHFDRLLWESLESIGQAVRADRAYIWQNFTQEGRPYCRQTHEWAEGVPPVQGEEFAMALPYDDVPFWRDSVKAGASLNGPVKDLPDAERAVLEPQGILSILIIPLHMGGEVWGFIGFDDCRQERTFTQAEQQVLQSAGILMCSGIVRNGMTRGLMEARTEMEGQGRLLRAVNEVADLLIRDVNDHFEVYILGSLRILAESVDADRSFIWSSTTRDGVLYGTELCEWARGQRSFTEEDERPVDIPLDSFLPEWRDTLLLGRNLNMLVRDMGEEFRSSPAGRGVLTTMNIPLVVHGKFWGLIGFDDMHRERLYTETEMDILKSGGMLIASAIMRNEMIQSVVEAKEEAQASNRAKSEFLSRMSHEIRTPLNAVIGMATLAEKSDDIDRVKYCLDRIDGSSRQLLSIINDVLDMSKIESGKFEIYPDAFDFEKMLQHSINVVQVRLDEKHQELALEMDRPFARAIISDELRLSQVLINLLTNAVKFTPDFGTITLRITEKNFQGNTSTLHVEVADNGIGIPKEQQAQLFSSFEQADGSITRRFGGTGLGLAICKKITSMMGGDIWVVSDEGQGATFTFEVQVGWGDKLEKTAATLRSGLRVLVVDDSPDVLEYFDNILTGFGLGCDTTDTGQEAIRLAQEAAEGGRPYALAFVDWTMPGTSGADTACALLDASGGHTTVVIISVADHSDIEPRMKQMGVKNFMAKPVLPSVLYNTIVQLTDDPLLPQREEAPARRDWKGKRVLLAEDVEINREIILALLEETGVAVDCAENGQEAVDKFAADPAGYGMVLMDVQMPVMDGLEATRSIRALEVPTAATVPIVAMTANAFKEDVQDCLAAGMNGHVAKPIEFDLLLDTMGQYLDEKD